MNPTNDLDKTVFISYRREPSQYLAHSIFRDLRLHGYDVFWDIESIGAGQFEPIILSEIGRRAHFILLLTNKTLDRCSEKGDWLRREIEYAMSLGRQIIPLMVDGFDLRENTNHLTGELSKLSTYNGMPFSIHYYDAGIEKLCNQFLTNKNCGKIIEATDNQEQVNQFIEEAMNEPQPSQAQLEAERLLNQGYAKMNQGDIDGAILDWTEAIHLNPNYDVAYSNRGAAKGQKEDHIGALDDLNKAISINPNNAMFFGNRGVAKFLSKDFIGCLADYAIAIELDSNNLSAYQNRANVYLAQNDLENALTDLNKAIELNPSDGNSRFLRSNIFRGMGDFDAALTDINIGIQTDSNNAPALNARGTIFLNKGKLEEAVSDYSNALNLKSHVTDSNLIAILYSNRGEANFLLKKFSRAVKDFETARKYLPASKYAILGIIVSYHAQGQVIKARRMWQNLLKLEPRYADMDWLQKELNWADALVEQARKLIAEQPE